MVQIEMKHDKILLAIDPIETLDPVIKTFI